MFYGKKIKEIENRLANAEKFEKGVCTIIDNYFSKNEQKDFKFSTNCASSKFCMFVVSVDERLDKLAKIEAENAELRKEKEDLEESYNNATAEHKKFIEETKKLVEAKDAIIKAQDKELTNFHTQLISKNREIDRIKNSTAKGGKL